jgi:hypothetical protein
MWKTKLFKTEESFKNWIDKNRHKYQITVIFVNNYYKGIEYKPLIKVY